MVQGEVFIEKLRKNLLLEEVQWSEK